MSRIIQHYNQNGLWKTGVWITGRILHLLASAFHQKIDYTLLISSWEDVPSFDERNYPGVHCKTLDLLDLPAIEEVFGKAVSEEFKKRIGSSNGFLIYKDKKLAGYSWASEKPVIKEGDPPFFFDVHPKEGYAYFYKDLIRPENRGMGLAQILMCYRIAEVRRNGIEKAFGIVKKSNVAQLRVTGKYGWISGGTISFRKYLWWIFEDMSVLFAVCDVRRRKGKEEIRTREKELLIA